MPAWGETGIKPNFTKEECNLLFHATFPDIKTRTPAEVFCVKSLISFLPVWAKRSSSLLLVHLRKSLWGTQYLCHPSLEADSWPTRPKAMRVIQVVFEFSSGIKKQSGNRMDWNEISCKIIYWQSGLHSWVKREIAKRKKKSKHAEQYILAFELFSCFWMRQIIYPRKHLCHCWYETTDLHGILENA